jgi:phosphoglycolate phosphatase
MFNKEGTVSGMHCKLCGSTEFKDVNKRTKVQCARCGSYERTRLMQLFLERHGVRNDMRVLHFAPETGLYRWTKPRVAEYICADFDLERYKHIPNIQFVDLMDTKSYDRFGTFDVILHSHVIEHIPYNYSALLLRLHKMLRPGGLHAFSVPIYGSCYGEHWGPMSNEEATTRYGQFDHIRRFSPADIERSIGALFRLETPDLEKTFGTAVLEEANIPKEFWSGWNGTSVFCLRPEDCLF